MELALVLPVIVLLVLVVVQVVLVGRDRVVVVHAARAAGRAVVVDPTPAAAARAAAEVHDEADVRLSGELRSGGMATVDVALPVAALPVFDRFVGTAVLRERLVVHVEGAG